MRQVKAIEIFIVIAESVPLYCGLSYNFRLDGVQLIYYVKELSFDSRLEYTLFN